MTYGFKTAPEVCSESISFEITDEGKIGEVAFHGGCPGSLRAVCSLVKGMTPDEAVSRIEGIPCGGKSTSCPDQLAKALKAYIASKK